jgi:hypothetical protein
VKPRPPRRPLGGALRGPRQGRAVGIERHHRRPRGVRQAKALLGSLRRHGSSPATLMGSIGKLGSGSGSAGMESATCAARSK